VIAMTAAAATGLRADPGVNGRIGIVGFCWGGGMVNRLSVGGEGLAAGVVYYGVAPDPADAARVQFPLLVHLASLDARVNGTWPAYETALKAAGKAHTIHMYEGANHAFNNDTSAERYSKAAADLAWERTIGFFRGQFGAAAGAG
jgi:carboxymethylenebutenolidase